MIKLLASQNFLCYMNFAPLVCIDEVRHRFDLRIILVTIILKMSYAAIMKRSLRTAWFLDCQMD